MSELARLVLGLVLVVVVAVAGLLLASIALHSLKLPELGQGKNKSLAKPKTGFVGQEASGLNKTPIPQVKERLSLRSLLVEPREEENVEVFRLHLHYASCLHAGESVLLYLKTLTYDTVRPSSNGDYMLEHRVSEVSVSHRIYRGALVELRSVHYPVQSTCSLYYTIMLSSTGELVPLPSFKTALPHVYLASTLHVHEVSPRGGVGVLRFTPREDVLLVSGVLILNYTVSSLAYTQDLVNKLLNVSLAELGRARAALPREFVSIPSTVEHVVRVVAQRIRARCAENLSLRCVVQELASWINQRYRYSRRVDIPPGQDTLLYTLARGRNVNCLLANLVAMLVLRSLGVPTRLVVGYLVQARPGHVVTVTADRGHAWVEVFVPLSERLVSELKPLSVVYSSVVGVWVPLDFTPVPNRSAGFRTIGAVYALSISRSVERGASNATGISRGSHGESKAEGIASGTQSTAHRYRLYKLYVVRGRCNITTIKLPATVTGSLLVTSGSYTYVELYTPEGTKLTSAQPGSRAVVHVYKVRAIKLRACVVDSAPPVDDLILMRVYSGEEAVDIAVHVVIRAETVITIDLVTPSFYLAPGQEFTVRGHVVTDRNETVPVGRVVVYVARSKSERPIVNCSADVHNGHYEAQCRVPVNTPRGKYVLYAEYLGTEHYLRSSTDPVIYVTNPLEVKPQCTQCLSLSREVRIGLTTIDLGYLLGAYSAGRLRIFTTGECTARLTSSGQLLVRFNRVTTCSIIIEHSGSPQYAYFKTKLTVYTANVTLCINDTCVTPWTKPKTARVELVRGGFATVFLKVHSASSMPPRGSISLLIDNKPLALSSGDGKTRFEVLLRPGVHAVYLCFGDICTLDPVMWLVVYRVVVFRNVTIQKSEQQLLISGQVLEKYTNQPLRAYVCVNETGDCAVANESGFFTLRLSSSSLKTLTLIVIPQDNYTLVEPYTVRLEKTFPAHYLATCAIVIGAGLGLLLARRFTKGVHERVQETHAQPLRLSTSTDRYVVELYFLDIEEDMPLVWTTGQPLRVVVHVKTADGLEVDSSRIKLRVENVYVGVGREHSLVFNEYGEYKLEVLVDDTPVLTTKIRIVDYRVECEHLYNMTILQRAREHGVHPEYLTPRQIMEKLSEHMDRELLEVVTEIFELARYSNHMVDRSHFVRMVRALRKLGFSVYK